MKAVDSIFFRFHNAPSTVELAHTSFNRTFTNCINRTDSETLLSRRSSSKNSAFVAIDVPSTLLGSILTPETQFDFDDMDGTSLQQLSKATIVMEASQPDRINPRSQPAEATCLRCRSNESRYSSQRSYASCRDCDLYRSRDHSEPKPKRRSCRSRSADRAETSERATKIKNAPLQVMSACTRCQHRKSKCSGSRPACTYCISRQIECSYDVAEGATRISDLKRRLRESSGRTQALGRVLAVMRESTADQAKKVFARLRRGDCLQNVLRSLPTFISSPNSRSKQAGSGSSPSGT